MVIYCAVAVLSQKYLDAAGGPNNRVEKRQFQGIMTRYLCNFPLPPLFICPYTIVFTIFSPVALYFCQKVHCPDKDFSYLHPVGRFCFRIVSSVEYMVLKLDGNSEIGAHARRNLI